MKNLLSRSQDSFSALNKLVDNGFYNGEVTYEGFELSRKHFPINHRVIGKVDSEGRFEVSSELKFPMGIMSRFLLGVIAVIMLIHLIGGNWLVAGFGTLLCLIIVASDRATSRKELRLFMDKYLVFKEQTNKNRNEHITTGDTP